VIVNVDWSAIKIKNPESRNKIVEIKKEII